MATMDQDREILMQEQVIASNEFNLDEFLSNEKKEYNLRRDTNVRAGRAGRNQSAGNDMYGNDAFSFNE